VFIASSATMHARFVPAFNDIADSTFSLVSMIIFSRIAPL
jgi:hypothetical protein